MVTSGLFWTPRIYGKTTIILNVYKTIHFPGKSMGLKGSRPACSTKKLHLAGVILADLYFYNSPRPDICVVLASVTLPSVKLHLAGGI